MKITGILFPSWNKSNIYQVSIRIWHYTVLISVYNQWFLVFHHKYVTWDITWLQLEFKSETLWARNIPIHRLELGLLGITITISLLKTP